MKISPCVVIISRSKLLIFLGSLSPVAQSTTVYTPGKKRLWEGHPTLLSLGLDLAPVKTSLTL